jgi:hypothetical protein
MSARRRIGAALAVVVAIAAVVGVVLAVQSPSATSAGSPSQPSGAATVQRRDLVETDTQSGTLSYASPQTVYNRLSGTVTWLPSVGRVIQPGHPLYKISGAPVILMTGTTPAYRDLSAADNAGPDILELNRNLVELGFNSEGIVVDDVWQAATTAAVQVFQESLGETPTGVLTLGQIVFLPGRQVVSAVDTTLGSTGGGSGGTPASAAADTSPTIGRPQFVSLTSATGPTGPTGPTGVTPGTKAHGKRGPAQTLAALIALLKAEAAQLRAESAELRAGQAARNSPSAGKPGSNKSNSSKSNSGSGGPSNGAGNSSNPSGNSGGGSATAILQTSSTRLIATVNLDASKQSEARVGEKVTVQMPNGTTVNGTISAVSPVAQSSSNSGNGGNGGNNNSNSGANNGSTATIPVTIGLSGHLSGAGLDQAAVSVNFAQARATNVLSVPVTALLATAGGGYAVQEAAAPHRLLPVTTGLFAAGYVEISGAGIYSGLAVTDSQG